MQENFFIKICFLFASWRSAMKIEGSGSGSRSESGSTPKCLGSGTWSLTYGTGSGSCYFHHWPWDANKKLIYLKKFFFILLFEGTFTSFFKDKKSKRSHKTVKTKVFLTIFCFKIKVSGSIPLISGSGSGRPENMWIRIRIRNTDCKEESMKICLP